MKAILVRYMPATNTKPSRWKATAEGGHSHTISYGSADSQDKGAAQAAVELARKVGWKGELIGGGLPNGDHCFCFSTSDRHPIEPDAGSSPAS
jgi:hypothetical protein